jgi:hypothetical protein
MYDLVMLVIFMGAVVIISVTSRMLYIGFILLGAATAVVV